MDSERYLRESPVAREHLPRAALGTRVTGFLDGKLNLCPGSKNVFDLIQKPFFCVREARFASATTFPERPNWETFASATVFSQQCFMRKKKTHKAVINIVKQCIVFTGVGLRSCINKVYLAVVISFSGRENFKMIPFYIMSRGFDVVSNS